MKAIRVVFLVAGLAGPALAQGGGGPTNGLADTAILRFFGGDVLHGTLAGTDTGALSWCRTDLLTPLAFRLDNVAVVQWPLERRPATHKDHRQVVELSNGDRLHGDLVAISGATLRLDTWYAGPLELKRAMVRRIANRSSLVTYSGPTGMDDWTAAPYASRRSRKGGAGGGGEGGGWRYANGAFFMTGPGGGAVGRNIALPDRANIEFDLKWRAQLNLRIGVHFDRIGADPNSGKGYLLTMADNYCTLNVLPYRMLGNPVTWADKAVRKQGHVSIRVNKARRSIALLFDGNPVGEWIDMADFAGGGNGFVFASEIFGQNGAIHISNMTITPWEELADNKLPARSETEDTVSLVNGDRVTGELQGFAAGQVVLRTEGGEAKLPMDRVLGIEMAGQKVIKPRRRTDDVRVAVRDGSRCTLRILKMDDRLLRGESENGGAIAISLDVLWQIRFNPYDFRPVPEGDDDLNLLNDTW